MPDRELGGDAGLLDTLPTDRLVEQGRQLIGLVAELAIEKVVGSVEGLADRLIDRAYHGGPGRSPAVTGGASPAEATPSLGATVKAGVTGVSESVRQALVGVAGPYASGQVTRTMSIVEQIDVDVPVRLAYDQWSQFQEFSQFMKKVSLVEKISDETSSWSVPFLWSHRGWTATIIEQIPDERIAWRSDSAKSRVDGAVSFHAVTPNMTRILLVLEYHPWGLLERTGSLWHAQVRRVRLGIKEFRYHIMTRAVLDPDSVQGWRGEIRNSKVVRTHEETLAAEAQERGEDYDGAEDVDLDYDLDDEDLDDEDLDDQDLDDQDLDDQDLDDDEDLDDEDDDEDLDEDDGDGADGDGADEPDGVAASSDGDKQ